MVLRDAMTFLWETFKDFFRCCWMALWVLFDEVRIHLGWFCDWIYRGLKFLFFIVRNTLVGLKDFFLWLWISQ